MEPVDDSIGQDRRDAVAKNAVIINFQKPLTACIIKRLDDSQPRVDLADFRTDFPV